MLTRLRGAATLLAAGALLASCGVTPPPGLPSPSPSLTSAVPVPTLGPTTADLEATGAVPRVLDPVLLEGVLRSVESRSSTTHHLFASWPSFGKPAIDAALTDHHESLITRFTVESPPFSTAAPAELNLGWDLIAASPGLTGIVTNEQWTGGSTQLRWTSWWLDLAADAVVPAAQLVDLPQANSALAAAAAQYPGIDLTTVGPDPVRAAPLLAFSPQGELLVGFDECQVAACALGLVTLTVPAETTGALLTSLGRAALEATLRPTSPSVPDASPTHTPASPTPISPSPSASTPAPPSRTDCRKAKCVALTFDDGPGRYTTALLGHLAKARVPATFYMLGQQVQTYPKIAKAVSRAGHQIGIHTWDHRSLPGLSSAAIHHEIGSSITAVERVTGKRPTTFRPPYGAMNAAVHAEATKLKVSMILWDVDTLDWKTHDPKKTIATAGKKARPGSIILAHDIHKETVAAVPGLIVALRKKGYTFVTVDQLLGKTQPGKSYFRR